MGLHLSVCCRGVLGCASPTLERKKKRKRTTPDHDPDPDSAPIPDPDDKNGAEHAKPCGEIVEYRCCNDSSCINNRHCVFATEASNGQPILVVDLSLLSDSHDLFDHFERACEVVRKKLGWEGGLVSVVACESHPGVYGKETLSDSPKLTNTLKWFDNESIARVKEMMANLAVTSVKVKVQDEEFQYDMQVLTLGRVEPQDVVFQPGLLVKVDEKIAVIVGHDRGVPKLFYIDGEAQEGATQQMYESLGLSMKLGRVDFDEGSLVSRSYPSAKNAFIPLLASMATAFDTLRQVLMVHKSVETDPSERRSSFDAWVDGNELTIVADDVVKPYAVMAMESFHEEIQKTFTWKHISYPNGSRGWLKGSDALMYYSVYLE